LVAGDTVLNDRLPDRKPGDFAKLSDSDLERAIFEHFGAARL
jgi:hypothetical protein